MDPVRSSAASQGAMPETAFAHFYEKASTSDVLKLAAKNLDSIASGELLYFDEKGSIKPEGPTWGRSFGQPQYRKLANLDPFFEKLDEAFDVTKMFYEAEAIYDKLDGAKKGLNDLKAFYSTKYTGTDLTERLAIIDKAIGKIDAMKTRFEEQIQPQSQLGSLEARLGKLIDCIRQTGIPTEEKNKLAEAEIKNFNEHKKQHKGLKENISECEIKKQAYLDQMAGEFKDLSREHILASLIEHEDPDFMEIIGKEKSLQGQLHELDSKWPSTELQIQEKVTQAVVQLWEKEGVEIETPRVPDFTPAQKKYQSDFSTFYHQNSDLYAAYTCLNNLAKCESGMKLYFQKDGEIITEKDAMIGRQIAGIGGDPSRNINNLAFFVDWLSHKCSDEAIPYKAAQAILESIEGAQNGLRNLMGSYKKDDEHIAIISKSLETLSELKSSILKNKNSLDNAPLHDLIDVLGKSLNNSNRNEKENFVQTKYSLSCMGLFDTQKKASDEALLESLFGAIQSSKLEAEDKESLFANALVGRQSITGQIAAIKISLGQNNDLLTRYKDEEQLPQNPKKEEIGQKITVLEGEIQKLELQLASEVEKERNFNAQLGLLKDRIDVINAGRDFLPGTPQEKIRDVSKGILPLAAEALATTKPEVVAAPQEKTFWETTKGYVNKDMAMGVALAILTRDASHLTKPFVEVTTPYLGDAAKDFGKVVQQKGNLWLKTEENKGK